MYRAGHGVRERRGVVQRLQQLEGLGRHCLSSAACLMRPRLFYALFVVSGITVTCYITRHF